MSVAIKIGSLLLKQISKPIAQAIKTQAMQHERFRRVCLNFAEFTHRHEQALQVRLMGRELVTIKPLSAERSIQLGAELIGEAILFAIVGGVLLEESLRKKMTEDETKRQHAEERAATEQRINALEEALVQSSAERRTTADAIGALRAELERQQWQSCMLRDRIEEMLETAGEQDGARNSSLSGGGDGSGERGGHRVRSLCSMRNQVAQPPASALSESAVPLTQASSSTHVAQDSPLPTRFKFSAATTDPLAPDNVRREIRDSELETMIPLEWRRRVRDNERKL